MNIIFFNYFLKKKSLEKTNLNNVILQFVFNLEKLNRLEFYKNYFKITIFIELKFPIWIGIMIPISFCFNNYNYSL